MKKKDRIAKKRARRRAYEERRMYVHCCGCVLCDDRVRAEVVYSYRFGHPRGRALEGRRPSRAGVASEVLLRMYEEAIGPRRNTEASRLVWSERLNLDGVSRVAPSQKRLDVLRAAFRKVVVAQDCPACSPEDCDTCEDEEHIKAMIATHDDGPAALAAVEQELHQLPISFGAAVGAAATAGALGIDHASRVFDVRTEHMAGLAESTSRSFSMRDVNVQGGGADAEATAAEVVRRLREPKEPA